MSDNEHYEEEMEYEEGDEVDEGQALAYDEEEGEEGHEEGAEDAAEEDLAELPPPEPEEQPLPEKKDWNGFVRIHLPSSTELGAPLREARLYFAENDVPLWTRYLVTDDTPYFDAVLSGRDVSDPVPEGEEVPENEEEDENAEEEEEQEGDGDNDEEGEDEDDDDAPRHRKQKGRNSKKSNKNGKSGKQSFDDDEGAADGGPVTFDEDGFMVIDVPYKGSVRFLLSQLLDSQDADADLGLPSIPVDEEELVFVATLIQKEDADAEDTAFNETNNIREDDEVPTVGPVKAPNLRSRIMAIPEESTVGDEDADEAEGAEGENAANGEEEDELNETANPSSSRAGHHKRRAEGEADDGQRAPLTFRMDALTLAAVFSGGAFRRALMRREMPSTPFLEGWLEVFALPVEGTEDQSTTELSTMVMNICNAASEVIEKKKNPDPIPAPKVDEEGNEMPPIVDAKHPPPPPQFVTVNENGTIAVPKLKMDLRWTFELEKSKPQLTSAMRYLRSRLLGTARMAPSHPNASMLSTPALVQSYLEFLMAVPRSSLVSWTRPKPDDEEDDVNDLDSIVVLPDDEQSRLTPLSHMLGTILLDLRTREARKKVQRKELKLSAFAAHKAVLCRRFLERNTVYDPLLVPAYAPKADGAADSNPLNGTVFAAGEESPNETASGPTSPVAAASAAPWPASLRLYDSDLVALACARYGALDTFREVLTLKNNLPRALDDTVGTYHLLFHNFELLERRCAVCLVDFSAVEVTSIPLLTKRSIVPALECVDDVFATIDKDDEYPSVFAERFWQQLSKDKAWRDAARTKCPSLYMRVQDEEIRMKALIDRITKVPATSSAAAEEGEGPCSGAYVLAQCDSAAGGLMHTRDVISPSVLYHAVVSRNIDVVVALTTKGVSTVKKPRHAEQPLMDALLDDDKRRREERANTPVAARTAADLLASEDDVADGLLSTLIALVEAGQSLEGVMAAGRLSVASELNERYGQCRKYKQLMKLWESREHERNTDPNQKYGLLRYLPAETANSPTRTRAR